MKCSALICSCSVLMELSMVDSGVLPVVGEMGSLLLISIGS